MATPNKNANTRGLLRKALSYASGEGSSTLVNVGAFTLLLRYLSPSEFGYLSVGQALSTWVQPILYMGASLVAVRLIAANPQQTPGIVRRMLGVRFCAAAVVSICTIAVALYSSDRQLAPVLGAYALLFMCYPAQPDFIAIGLHRPRVYSISKWTSSASFICFVLLLTRTHVRAWMIPLAYTVSLVLSALYGYLALWPALRSSGHEPSIANAPLFRGAIVVVAAQFLQMGQSSIDVILLKSWKIPVALVGDYNAMGRVSNAACLPFIALIYSLAPLYVKHLADGDMKRMNALERRFRICLAAAGVMGAVVIGTVGPRVLEMVSGRQMPVAYQLAPMFAVGYLLIALQNSYTAVLVYGGATHLYLLTYAAGFATTALCAVLFIPHWGTMGAAASEIVGLAVILVTSYSFHRQFLRSQSRALTAPSEAKSSTIALSRE